MSVIKVNQITNRDGSGGPIISGLTTVGVVTSGVSIGVTNLYVEQINFGQTGILTAAVSVGTTDLYVSGTAFGNVTGNVTGDVTGNADTATTLAIGRFINGVEFDGSTDITVPVNAASETSDTQCFPLFVTGPSGNLSAKSNTSLTFDSAAGTLVATAFSGTNVNLSGVGTITNLFEVRSDDGTPGRIDYYCESSNAHYTRIQAAPHSEYSGNATAILPTISGDIIIGDNASQISQSIWTSGIITATTFVGALTGEVNAAAFDTNASGVVITGVATATSFSGNLTGNVTGNADTATSATSATTATNANNINLADESSDTTCFPVFATAATGNQAPKTDSDRLTYNASSGLLVASTHQATSIIADSTLRVGSASTTSMDLYVVGNSASGVHNLGSKSSSFAIDMSTGNNYNFTIAGNITLNNPTNTQPGQSGVIMITQDGTGSRTLAYQSHWNFVDGTAPTITAGAGTTSVLAYMVQDTDMIITTSILALG
jgi:hypothetical protein